jgi:hypothetical protein
MSLYKLVVAYDGTPFNGFQRQAATSALRAEVPMKTHKQPYMDSSTGLKPNAITIQECLEGAVSGGLDVLFQIYICALRDGRIKVLRQKGK